jgi:alpha-acetolactate decarboxylase
MKKELTNRSATVRILYLFLSIGLFAAGCDSRPKGTFQSSRRIVASYYRSPVMEVMNYFPTTNEVRIFEGTLGNFTGTVTGIVASSNASGWHMQFVSDGQSRSGAKVGATQHLDLPYPTKRKITIPQLGEVTVWFLSDEEISRNAEMFAK